jgi:tyrosinase
VRIRKNVWKLNPLDSNPGTPWDPILLWYAKAVAHMQTRPIGNPASWEYQAAIHEYNLGQPPNTQPVNTLPSAADRARFWTQCQHQSWFFLPWHRMYLAYFEEIVIAAIAEVAALEGVTGPSDWALPYWNYSDTTNPKARSLPPAFFLANLPNGAQNKLRITQRKTGCNTGQIIATPGAVDLVACLTEPNFSGQPTGGNPGFGGPPTGFSHGGGNLPFGKLEGVPHGSMHVAVGGLQGGFMSGFNTAGLDPIFWLHHANIDRLWQVWQKRNVQFHNPTQAAWLAGQVFKFHDASGAIATGKAAQFQQTTTCPLPYDYDDVSDPLSASHPVAPTMAAAAPGGGSAMSDRIPEMVGASPAPVVLTGQPATVRLAVVPPTGPAAARFAAAAAGPAPTDAPPPEMYVNIENITGAAHAPSYDVYVNVPEGDEPHDHPELYVGLLPMFGLVEASRGDQNHPGDGLHYALDIGPIARRLQSDGRWDPNALHLTFVPEAAEPQTPAAAAVATPVSPVRIGRVSLYVS